jgi:hypothetical protein
MTVMSICNIHFYRSIYTFRFQEFAIGNYGNFQVSSGKNRLDGISDPIFFTKNFKLSYLGISLTQTFSAISFKHQTTVHTNTMSQSSIYSTDWNLQLTGKMTRNFISRHCIVGSQIPYFSK